MDALKIITEGQMKQDAPVIRVGDTVKVHVKIREGERERIQVFEAAYLKLLPFAAFPMALAWSVFSQCILPMLQKWNWFAPVRCAGASCTICATGSVRLQKLRNSFAEGRSTQGTRVTPMSLFC